MVELRQMRTTDIDEAIKMIRDALLKGKSLTADSYSRNGDGAMRYSIVVRWGDDDD